jgi:LytS/YehU family sensor histidine kinase
MTYAVGSIAFFGLSKHIYTHLKLRRDALQLRIEKQQAELNYLRSQTNPHFLFNTLNNIYSLASEKSDLAPESIMRLSRILRYMLYETGGSSVSIEQEIQTINNYLELERLRYDESLKISFEQNIEDKNQHISPLLLIPLIENAFKHGTSETINKPFVNIHLTLHKQQLTLIVENSADPDSRDVQKESIGLTNLRRQLSLLYRDSNLEIQKTTETFVASLKINLTSHV